MPLTFSNITNQKSVKISLGRGERNAVMLGVKFYVMDAEKWGEYIGEMVDTEDTVDEGGEVVKAPKRKFVDTLRSNKKAVLEVCTEVVVLSEDGLVIDLSVPETDGDGNPLKDEYDKPITRKVTAQLKKGDAMQGEVLDAFFSFVTTVQQVVEYYSKNVLLGAGGRPIPVTNAQNLWKSSSSHKGMIQVWRYNTMLSSSEASNTNEANWLTGNSLYPTKKRYGFQFMYNPGSVTQQWSGLPNINVSYVMSGKDKTPYVAPIETSSSLSFAIPINRVNDMALLSERGVATVAADSTNLNYYGQKVDASELEIIRNRGTMYDVEYLLKTLVGFEVYSELRGYKTADIGWLLGYAIELHLGKDLRYIGTISYVDVQHTIFNNEMIPVYSTLTLTVTRRVEPVVGASTRIGGTGSGRTSVIQ
jgi:hypothetical protein